MITYEEAVSILRKNASKSPVKLEIVPIEAAVGRVAAEEVVSGENVPAFDNSAMDGFAVMSSATIRASEKTPVRLKVLGTIAAGADPASYSAVIAESVCGCAWEIMAGAHMPPGRYDGVVKIEDVQVIRDENRRAVEIVLKSPVKAGANVRLRGTDFKPGKATLNAGDIIQPHHVLAFATLGITQIRVRRKLRIAIVSTGRELVHHGETRLLPSMIRNSTAPYLASVLSLLGADVLRYGIILDEPSTFEVVIAKVLQEEPDMIITTGAESMGKFDFVVDSVKKIGGEILFHKAAIRPGEPVLFARFGDSGPALFGVPGNPVSTAVGVRFFVDPYIRALLSVAPEQPTLAKLAHNTSKPEGLRCFYKANIWIEPEGATVSVLQGQESFKVSPILDANSWVVLDEKCNAVREGEVVEVYPMISGLKV